LGWRGKCFVLKKPAGGFATFCGVNPTLSADR
jgi:hypothetical protein